MNHPARRQPNFTQADVRRAIKAALDMGLPVRGYRIGPDGSIEVTIAEPGGIPTDLERWRQSRAR